MKIYGLQLQNLVGDNNTDTSVVSKKFVEDKINFIRTKTECTCSYYC